MIHSVMLATRGRARIPETQIGLLWFWKHFVPSVAEPDNLEIVFGCDEDDPDSVTACKAFYAPFKKRVLVSKDPGNLREKYSAIEAECDGQVLWYGADDFRFDTPGWDTAARIVYERAKVCFLTLEDDIWWTGKGGLLDCQVENPPPGFFGLSREWIEAAGYSYPPIYNFQCGDNHLCDLARRVERACPGHGVLLRGVKASHCSRGVGAAPSDETFERTQARSETERSRQTYTDNTQEREKTSWRIVNAIWKMEGKA